jgi:hypothetical protein
MLASCVAFFDIAFIQATQFQTIICLIISTFMNGRHVFSNFSVLRKFQRIEKHNAGQLDKIRLENPTESNNHFIEINIEDSK